MMAICISYNLPGLTSEGGLTDGIELMDKNSEVCF